MATSGTYSFAVTRDDIINAAFRKMQVFGPFDAGPQTVDITNAAFALNVLTKAMANKGTPLWCLQTLQVPMLTGVSQYSLGSPRPLNIKYAFLRNASGNDVEVEICSRYDYDQLGDKSSTGVVNQLWYDPQIGNTVAPPGSGIVTVYDVPADSTTTLFLVIQRSLQDFDASTDNPDFPQEAYLMLVYALANELSLDYLVKADVRAEIAGRSVVCTAEFFGTTQDQASIYFTPSERTK
jgi:hypothetical protein